MVDGKEEDEEQQQPKQQEEGADAEVQVEEQQEEDGDEDMKEEAEDEFGSVTVDNRENEIRNLLNILKVQDRSVLMPNHLRASVSRLIVPGQKLPGDMSIIAARATCLSSEDCGMIQGFKKIYEELKAEPPNLELRVVDGSYAVTELVSEGDGSGKRVVKTVFNSSFMGKMYTKFKGIFATQEGGMTSRKKVLIEKVNLLLEPGMMYLVLGAPGSGKSLLLKLIADRLERDADHIVGGSVSVNGVSSTDPAVFWQNVASYTDQNDTLHAHLTVMETLLFAWQCRAGGTHAKDYFDMDDPDVKKAIERLDEELFLINKVMDVAGIARVKNSKVGDNVQVRGVSGGERKRVTVAEMGMCNGVPVSCADEISTGLDSATTFDIVRLSGVVAKMTRTTKVISLLQPSPETVGLFDGIVLMDSGRIIFDGPVEYVVGHFESLGYELPTGMAVADWLQILPTADGAEYLVDKNARHLTSEEFWQKCQDTPRAQQFQDIIKEEFSEKQTEQVVRFFSQQFHNSPFRSLALVTKRELLLWWRDKKGIRTRLMQDFVMAIVVGTLFWQGSDDPTSVLGVQFFAVLFLTIGAFLRILSQFQDRLVFYKHRDAKFFPAWSWMLARSLSQIPTSMMDSLVYGSIVYWFVGLAYDDGATVWNYIVFLLIIFVASVAVGLVFAIFPAAIAERTSALAAMNLVLMMMVLFSGFTVQPASIPNYWIWAYWINILAWILRALILNEYQSGKYDDMQLNGKTVGENTLIAFGFIDEQGEPFDYEWVWYAFGFAAAVSCVGLYFSSYFSTYTKYDANRRKVDEVIASDPNSEMETEEPQDYSDGKMPFQKVNFTFKDIHYTVQAGDMELQLLNGVDGFLEAGKMTALMGSSGAGKTTLMDCLSLRKTSGTITGDIRLNGHLQEPDSFRRCTGYVEQFDEQSAQLTVLETVQFSARLRLDERDPFINESRKESFINETLANLELIPIKDVQAGDLSIEQKKRVSIAVELVANPSIIFLDEPTSGLDSRAAAIVMRGLRRIASSGRAVCATIHQPSIPIFDSFDCLLLLKRGGEVVFFGDLGEKSCSLIDYLESCNGTTPIEKGENPATWMLTCIGAGSGGGPMFDYSGNYAASMLKSNNVQKIDEFSADAQEGNRIQYTSKYATSFKTQLRAVTSRIFKVYWRTPSYNSTRLILASVIALIFGSLLVSQRTPEDESDMLSRVSLIYVTVLFLAVVAYNSVLGPYEAERNIFYRQKASLMYDEKALILAFTVAELPFIMLTGLDFTVIFYFMIGFSSDAGKFFSFYFFFTLNLGIWTFLGQMMMSLVKEYATAHSMGGMLASLSALFGGVLIRPQNINSFWIFAYWIFPFHYVLEGILTTQFKDDDTPIEANFMSPFYQDLLRLGTCQEGEMVCTGTAELWVDVAFGGEFDIDHIPHDIGYLVELIVIARLVAWYGLRKFNFLGK